MNFGEFLTFVSLRRRWIISIPVIKIRKKQKNKNKPPVVPPTIPRTVLKDCGAEDEVDVKLGLSRVGVMAADALKAGEIDNEERAVDGDEALDEDEAAKEAADEEEYADEVSNREDERKPTRFRSTAAPLFKNSPWPSS